MEIGEFVERWNNKKYDKADNSSFSKRKAMYPTEMQRHVRVYPIGYMAGTTERGKYDTVIKFFQKNLRTTLRYPIKPCFNMEYHREYGILHNIPPNNNTEMFTLKNTN